ncbi:MAG: SH3 domain-containing protein [Mesorhizobium sp.]|uniref:SH3 domain-containing protein n=1 Tax=Mesorhizobium sp. TaxID=1871066 RepID=UPI001226C351|nr:SH3 domain-containing protein [Mesorhizobium sp.]TIW08026.1 MAG: SH3 domain-containing protein [Mesorhizobium sp.]
MNEPFSFGAPERRPHVIAKLHCKAPSFWQGVRSNSHLVIAAVGTAALLGVAGIALWLALPGSDRQAIASPAQSVPTIPVRTTKIAPASANATTMATAPQAARKADAVSPVVAAKEAKIPALASNDPRWTATDTKTASSDPAPAPSDQTASRQAEETAQSSDTAFAEPAAQSDAAASLSKVAAPDAAPAKDDPDGAKTAAIPAPDPQTPEAQASAGDDGKAKTQQVSAASTGRILRAVTMRAGPKQKAAAMITVPAKTSVQVISCKKWCQIVYNGKRGWIYKTYIKTGA